jgi:hypothetical protein
VAYLFYNKGRHQPHHFWRPTHRRATPNSSNPSQILSCIPYDLLVGRTELYFVPVNTSPLSLAIYRTCEGGGLSYLSQELYDSFLSCLRYNITNFTKGFIDIPWCGQHKTSTNGRRASFSIRRMSITLIMYLDTNSRSEATSARLEVRVVIFRLVVCWLNYGS